MQIKDIIQTLEAIAPSVYQESYDNAGLIVGDAQASCTGVLTCLDSTEAVIEEAIRKNCNLVVAHHPIVFKGLKSITGKTYVERVILKAIQNHIAIYAIHTNLDNVYSQGVNGRIADQLGLQKQQILAPKATLKSLTVYVPIAEADALKLALQSIGANVQSDVSSLRNVALGTFPDADGSTAQIALHAIFSASQQGAIKRQLSAYSSLNYTIHTIENSNHQVGSGMIGELPEAMNEKDFLAHIKKSLETSTIKHTALCKKKVKKVALCGGSGGFLLQRAIGANADFFITSDYKYHEFFDADGKIVIADVGHFESEQFTINLLSEIIREKFGNFAVHCTDVNTNPVQYYN